MKKVSDVKDALEVREKGPRAEYVVPALEHQGVWHHATGSGGIKFPIETSFFRPLDASR